MLDNCQSLAYTLQVIKTSRSKPLKLFWEKGDASKLPVQNHAKVERQLDALDVAQVPGDMNIPGWKFHSLQGVGRWSVWVTGNYRITFTFEGQDAAYVDLEDYH